MSQAVLDKALWYVGRGTGVVSLVLLTLVVVLGIVTRSGRPLPGLPRFAVTAVHRSISLLAVSFLALHVVTLTLDPTAQLRWIDAIVPFGGSWRPQWVGLGTVGLDLIGALIATSLLRHRIGRRAWRAVHWTAYAAWPAALVHSLGTGTDIHRPWMVLTLAGCALAAFAAVVWRVSANFLDPSGRLPGTLRPQQPRPALRGPDPMDVTRR